MHETQKYKLFVFKLKEKRFGGFAAKPLLFLTTHLQPCHSERSEESVLFNRTFVGFNNLVSVF